jgi:hypothetical protein
MIGGCFARDTSLALRNIAAVFACLPLTFCAAPADTATWLKAGADDTATAHEAGDCRTHADAALANQQGINQDINATLGGNWQRARTTGVVDQSMRQQDANYADQIFDSCMRAKGFKKAG